MRRYLGRPGILLVLVFWVSTTGRVVAQEGPGEQPNIVLFIVDDLGWQDTSVPLHTVPTPFNARYHTPAVARLAAQGMRFTDAYAASPVCTPTRTSIMTGRNPARTHITNWTLRNDRDAQETGPDDYPLRSPHWDYDGLQPGDVTLPALLRQGGYRTIHVGKAHFGALGTTGADARALGFDVNVAGHAAGAPGSYYGRDGYRRGEPGSPWDVPGLDAYHGTDTYLTEALTREAEQAVAAAVEAGTPFFLNMAHYAVHTPIMADSQYVGRYAGLDPAEAAYASMIEGTDASLSTLLARLDSLGVAARTLIVFTSDNGGLSAHARGLTPMGTGPNTHNLPLRSGKGSAYEGGVRVPLVVAWARPDTSVELQRRLRIPAGAMSAVPVVSDDLFPTLLAVAGVDPPEGYGYDGLSLVPLLRGEGALPRDLLGWHYPHKWGVEGPGLDPFTSVREGDWKLIYFYHERRWELYDLARDLGETVDLRRSRPEVARRLAGRMIAWMQSMGAQVPHRRDTDAPVAWPALEDL